ncbi:hypothetical protein [uncultured Dysosmobacter sp.]|uniref:hypothetical protein n=1 Tax=uncultured Dysosmobacter sp. TaxID=2591384 RepID=UPI0026137DFE|nr:hypothetical protein [uncultured Dysosmobacter sp.]
MDTMPPDGPRKDRSMTYADKCGAAQGFHRKSLIRNLCFLLAIIALCAEAVTSFRFFLAAALVLAVTGAVFGLLTGRCPICGRPIRRRWSGRWYFINLLIPYECPDCDFTTDRQSWRPL